MRLQIAATKNDWSDLFAKIDRDRVFKFYRRGVYSTDNIIPVNIDMLPELGVSKTGIMVSDTSYVIDVIGGFKLRMQSVNGVDSYIVDGLINKDAVIFYHGGVFSDNFFVIGEMTSQSELSRDVLKACAKVMKRWERESGIYFGDDCLLKMKSKYFTFDYRYEKWEFFTE